MDQYGNKNSAIINCKISKEQKNQLRKPIKKINL